MNPRIPILLVAAALVLSACGEDASETNDPTVPDDPDAVLLDVTLEGGFAPVEMILGRVPRFVLTADRTLYFEGPVPAIYPGPLLPNVQATRLDEETFQSVLDYVADIGFPEFEELVNDDAADQVADAPHTVVTWYDAEGRHRFDVYALGFVDAGTDARVAQLASLVTLLEDAAMRGASIGEYEPDRIEVNAGVRDIPAEPGFENVRPWPLPDAFTEMDEAFGSWRCAVYEGDEAVRLLDEFRQANQATVWEDGDRYTLVVRPLFPHEEGCTTGG